MPAFCSRLFAWFVMSDVKTLLLNVQKENEGQRLDKFISENAEVEGEALTRSAVQKIIEDEGVTVNGVVLQKNYKVKAGDVISVLLPQPEPLEAEPENIPLNIVFEDNDLIVVDKPKGMVVHPAAGHYSGTLVNALLYHCGESLSGINGVMRPGIVHRIDKDTSGLLIVAKNDFAHQNLALQIKEHSFSREYECVVRGVFKDSEGTINAPIGRDTKDRKRQAVVKTDFYGEPINGKEAVTHYTVITQYPKYAHVRCKLETGRTHQIRVHMAHIGHPVAGDEVYNKNILPVEKCLRGQCLHAKLLGFVHPRSGEYLEFQSELPQYFTEFLEKIT